jgi:predicted metal-binding membrane protein
MMVAMMIPAASPVILLFTEINRRRPRASSHVRIDRTIPAGLSDGVDGL